MRGMKLVNELKRGLKSRFATSNDWHQNVMAALELVREEVQRADRQIREAGSREMANGDFRKLGKLNHNKEVEQKVDWPKFRGDATALLERYGCKYYIKEDLRKAS